MAVAGAGGIHSAAGAQLTVDTPTLQFNSTSAHGGNGVRQSPGYRQRTARKLKGES